MALPPIDEGSVPEQVEEDTREEPANKVYCETSRDNGAGDYFSERPAIWTELFINSYLLVVAILSFPPFTL